MPLAPLANSAALTPLLVLFPRRLTHLDPQAKFPDSIPAGTDQQYALRSRWYFCGNKRLLPSSEQRGVADSQPLPGDGCLTYPRYHFQLEEFYNMKCFAPHRTFFGKPRVLKGDLLRPSKSRFFFFWWSFFPLFFIFNLLLQTLPVCVSLTPLELPFQYWSFVELVLPSLLVTGG